MAAAAKVQSACAKVFRGTVVHSLSVSQLQLLEDAVLGVSSAGRVLFLEKASELPRLCTEHAIAPDSIKVLPPSHMLMPGFVDTHIHAPQYVFTGTGYDLQLMEWLKRYTFPAESKFASIAHAREVYPKVVDRLIRNGTTTACYFATIHAESTLALADIVAARGQRALVGKVCMDQESPDFYCETTAQSLADADLVVQKIRDMKNPLVQPVLTPRFVPTCSKDLLGGLGKIAAEKDVHVQSHLSENRSEIDFVRHLFPDLTYTGVYDKYGLLTNKTVMAHCVHLSDDEVALIRRNGAGISHCANSNFSIMSGVAPIRKYLDEKLKIGLGTDVAGGYSSSILDAMRMAILASKMHSLNSSDNKPLKPEEAFFLATLGGSQVLAMDGEIGNFETGKAFDALVVNLSAQGSPVDIFDSDSLEDKFSKFLFLGDDRNVESVYVNGRLVHGQQEQYV